MLVDIFVSLSFDLIFVYYLLPGALLTLFKYDLLIIFVG